VQGREESVEEFVRRNLGDEVFERLIEPFCSGVYAGDPAKLSMKAAFGKVWRLEDIGGSIVGGTIKLLQERKKNPPPPRDTRLPKPKGQTVGSSQTVGPHCSSSVHFALFQFPPTRVQSQTCDPKARTQNLLEKTP
jgi:protoporphyrinogen oxidase